MKRGTSKTQRKTDFYLNPLPARSFGTKKINGGLLREYWLGGVQGESYPQCIKHEYFLFIYVSYFCFFFCLCICNVDLVSLPPNRLFVRLILFIWSYIFFILINKWFFIAHWHKSHRTIQDEFCLFRTFFSFFFPPFRFAVCLLMKIKKA